MYPLSVHSEEFFVDSSAFMSLILGEMVVLIINRLRHFLVRNGVND